LLKSFSFSLLFYDFKTKITINPKHKTLQNYFHFYVILEHFFKQKTPLKKALTKLECGSSIFNSTGTFWNYFTMLKLSFFFLSEQCYMVSINSFFLSDQCYMVSINSFFLSEQCYMVSINSFFLSDQCCSMM
jgi:hypothetical protein